MLELEQRTITNSECQPDCRCCDWTNTLVFQSSLRLCTSAAARQTLSEIPHTAKHSSAIQHKQQRSRATLSLDDNLKDAHSLSQTHMQTHTHSHNKKHYAYKHKYAHKHPVMCM